MSPSCAARSSVHESGRPAAQAASATAADNLIAEGCFDCLVSARDIYARLVTEGGPWAAAAGLFRANALLALRANELGWPKDTHLTAARQAVTAGSAAILKHHGRYGSTRDSCGLLGASGLAAVPMCLAFCDKLMGPIHCGRRFDRVDHGDRSPVLRHQQSRAESHASQVTAQVCLQLANTNSVHAAPRYK